MATNRSTLQINASPEKVWEALTKPEKVKLWQYGSELLTSWEPGTDISFVTKWEDQVFKQWGKIVDFQPYTRISYRLFAPRPDLEDKPEHYFVMNYVLTDNNGQTLLEIIQEDNRPNAVQEAPQGEENPVLQALRHLVENA
jgi:uncharacterized protein YndB with AHSA1/START domain